MRTKQHIYQQFVVEFGCVSVNTDALLGEASRDARFFADSQNDTSVVEHLRSIQIVINCVNVSYTYDKLILMGQYTGGCEGLLAGAGGKQHITEAAPNESETW